MMLDTGSSPQSRIVWLIAVTTLARLVFAASLGLGVDESYMVAAGRTISLGYFDHPPAAWILSWGAAHLFGTEAPLAVRLPFIALFALSTWLMARLGEAVADARAGLWAAVLLNLSPVFGITGGSWVLPDGPLLCALLGAALCLVHATAGRGFGWWCGAGLCAGLALAAKYSALLSIGGAFVYLLCDRGQRHWLRRPAPYAAMALALLVFSPVVLWNADHGWASFAFQGARAVGLRFRPLMPLTTLLGEGLFVLPWIWAPMLVLLVRGLWSPVERLRADRLLACLAAPPIVAFALISGWSSQRVLFHWAAPGYLMLFPLLGRWVAAHRPAAWLRRAILGTAALLVLAMAAVGLQTRFDWLGGGLVAMMRKDPTLEGIDWVSLRADLTARGLLPSGVLVGIPNWRDAGKIGYALGPEVTVLCLSQDARQFGFAHPLAAYKGQDVLLLSLAPTAMGAVFERVEALPDSAVRHRGRLLQTVSVARGYQFAGRAP